MPGAFVFYALALCMKIVSAIDRIESTSHCTVFTALVASTASGTDRSITSRNPSPGTSNGIPAGWSARSLRVRSTSAAGKTGVERIVESNAEGIRHLLE